MKVEGSTVLPPPQEPIIDERCSNKQFHGLLQLYFRNESTSPKRGNVTARLIYTPLDLELDAAATWFNRECTDLSNHLKGLLSAVKSGKFGCMK